MPLFYFAVRFSHNQLFRHLNSPWAITLGTYSYAIYLIHYVVIRLIATNAPAIAAKSFILFPTALLISIVYAAAVDRFVDRFFRQLRRKYRPQVATKLSRSMSKQKSSTAANESRFGLVLLEGPRCVASPESSDD